METTFQKVKFWVSRMSATYINGFKTLANHKQYSNHAPDLVPQESATSNLNSTKLIAFKTASEIEYSQIFEYILTSKAQKKITRLYNNNISL